MKSFKLILFLSIGISYYEFQPRHRRNTLYAPLVKLKAEPRQVSTVCGYFKSFKRDSKYIGGNVRNTTFYNDENSV